MATRKLALEDRMMTVGSAVALKHIEALEHHAKKQGMHVSEFIRALVHEKFAAGEGSYLILKDIDPELLHALEQQAEKLGKDIASAAKELLANSCRPVA